MKRIALFCAALIASACVLAQAAPQATLTWTAPTTYTDGSSIPSTVVVTYNVYQGPSATTLVKVASGVTTLTSSITTGLISGQTYFWAVTAVANGLEGAKSNVGTKVFAAVPPNAVTLTVN
jgi:hypothetical protein